MSFTDIKIKNLYRKLSNFEFSMGFTAYKHSSHITYDCSNNTTSMIAEELPPTFQPISDDEHIATFPIVFDYFDAILDKKLNISGASFKEKEEKINTILRGDREIDFLEFNTYSIARNLRNSIIHNDLRIKKDNNGISLGLQGGIVYKLEDMMCFNRLVFNVALRCLNNNMYSRYEKCAALAIYKKLTGDINCPHIINNFSSGNLIDTIVYPRTLLIFTNINVEDSMNLLDFLYQLIGTDNDMSSNQPFKSDKLFKLEINGETLLIPSELINRKKDLTFSDICQWNVPIQ